MMRSAGAVRNRPKRASDRAIDQRGVLTRSGRAPTRPWPDSTLAFMRRRGRRAASGQGLLESYQVFEPLGHGQAAPDHVVHDRNRLRVVLGVPGLLESPNHLGLVVLLAQHRQIDPLIVGLDDALVLVHLRVWVVEPGEQAPLPLDVPVAV